MNHQNRLTAFPWRLIQGEVGVVDKVAHQWNWSTQWPRSWNRAWHRQWLKRFLGELGAADEAGRQLTNRKWQSPFQQHSSLQRLTDKDVVEGAAKAYVPSMKRNKMAADEPEVAEPIP